MVTLYKVWPAASVLMYRVTHLLADLGWVDLDLGCSTGRWAGLQLRCCQSKTVEHPKSKSTQPGPRGDGSPCIDPCYHRGTGKYMDTFKTNGSPGRIGCSTRIGTCRTSCLRRGSTPAAPAAGSPAPPTSILCRVAIK